jgi:Antibiotic biosynthesis monooxygenase
MDGLIAKISAVPGQRDALIAILAAGSASMPGCLSYVVSKDREDESGIWITEMWDSETKSHGVVDAANRQGGDHQGAPTDRQIRSAVRDDAHRRAVETWESRGPHRYFVSMGPRRRTCLVR